MAINDFLKNLSGKELANMDETSRTLMENATLSNRIVFLSALMQSPLPAGDFMPAIKGDVIEAKAGGYVSAYKNDTPYPVAVTIYAQFTGVSGKQVKMSMKNIKESDAIVDYLSTVTSAPSWGIKRVSDTILLLPKQEIFLANALYGSFALVAADKFVPRVFDLAKYLIEQGWMSKN